MTKKPALSLAQIWNMNFGFLGIQFGWQLQMVNMSAIYEYLGAEPEQIPLLWMAAPFTGLLVQPIIGQMSDRTWTWMGRRRPYFLVGAILASLALLFMPNSSSLWMAAGLLWVLDASANISMEPFRAFVADMLPEHQRNKGFAFQSFFIGVGSVVAGVLPWLLTNVFNVTSPANEGHIPFTIKLAFYIGALVFLSAVVWTCITTKEYPPDDLDEFKRQKDQTKGLKQQALQLFANIAKMPPTMRQLGLAQIATWIGLFCMWLYFTPAIARSVFHAVDKNSPSYQSGVEWGGMCFSFYSLVCFFFAFALPPIANRIGRRLTHTICLVCGGLGLVSVPFIDNQYVLLLSMLGVGIAWSSILSMPYAILASVLPEEKFGVYMGIFNFFIVIPELIATLVLGTIMKYLFNNNLVLSVATGGVCLLLAAVLMQRVKSTKARAV